MHNDSYFQARIDNNLQRQQEHRQTQPFYWLVPPCGSYGGRVYLLVANRAYNREHDFSYQIPTDNDSLIAAYWACRHLCLWGDYDRTEETPTAFYRSFEFSDSRSFLKEGEETAWQQIQPLMQAMLGEPGRWPTR